MYLSWVSRSKYWYNKY